MQEKLLIIRHTDYLACGDTIVDIYRFARRFVDSYPSKVGFQQLQLFLLAKWHE